MGFIYNSSVKDFTGTVFGNYHTVKSGQIKLFQDNVSRFMATERGYCGLVDLPDAFEDIEYRESAEAKQILAEKKQQGVENRCKYLSECIKNEEISLKANLDMKNLKIDPKLLASPQMPNMYKELIGYRKTRNDEAAQRAKELADLSKQVTDSSVG